MTIKSKKAFTDALWDWGFLSDCFEGMSGAFGVSDIDGMVERKGHVLFLEAKGPGKKVSGGQMRAFEALINKGFTVLIIWGEAPDKPQEMQIWYPNKRRPEPKKPAGQPEIKDIVRRWFKWANTNANGGKA